MFVFDVVLTLMVCDTPLISVCKSNQTFLYAWFEKSHSSSIWVSLSASRQRKLRPRIGLIL